ncbi:DUF58 domain-containing protein [Lysobacter korlensis]|uniref:DUF58 domain-containing protein n=1 Tax=Lysobacter korlensis TaxID=553636 RepID=A0ABV6RNU1_9GAMM
MAHTRGRLRLSRRGWAIFVGAFTAVVIAYAAGYREALYLASFAAALLAASILVSVLRRPRLAVVRRFGPPVATAGAPVAVEIDARNTGWTPSGGAEGADQVAWSTAPGPVIPIPPIAPRRATRLRYTIRAPHRGIFAVGPLVVDYEDPFGLVRTTLRVGSGDRLIVAPPLVRLPTTGGALTRAEGESTVIQRRASGSFDDLITREYRPGDALRRVHWKASARRGDLMVRQEEPRSHPEVRLVLDTRRAAYDDVAFGPMLGPSESESFEWAIRMTGSMAAHLSDQGFRVTILESAGAQLIAPVEGMTDATRDGAFLESLAAAELLDAREPEGRPQHWMDHPAPVLAVVADSSTRMVRWMSDLRSGRDRATAFVLPSAGRSTRERLEAAGWLCVSVDPASDPVEAWSLAVRQGEPLRVR